MNNPLKAIIKRFIWRTRWLFNKSPWILTLPNGSKIETAKLGAGALIYYLGYSEPEIAYFVNYFLKPGMTFVDIGAHLGEYCILSSPLVEKSGKIFAFEPNPDIYPFLTRNIYRNSLINVVLDNHAVSSKEGEIIFQIHKEASMSSLKFNTLQKVENIVREIHVSTINLDNYFQNYEKEINLIKVDVEGAETEVIIGAKNLCSKSKGDAPTWIIEYNPGTAISTGRDAKNILYLLWEFKYYIYELKKGDVKSQFQPSLSFITNPPNNFSTLVASKVNLYL
ncbi:MAG: FkbM family methyltransferase [Anaerolineaceae bacterium]|nr:FkbM family methyltransferase [Anaerolineaceae bacterium]